MPKNYADLFNLENRFEHYLELVKLDKAKMSDVQLVETKRAFMGGFGSAIVALNNDLDGLNESEAILTLESLFWQIAEFWTKESIDFEM